MNDTAEQHLAKAAECEQRAAESFERCDTDGFLSQWASGLTAQLHRAKAKIIERDGLWSFTGLYAGNRRVKATIVNTRYGQSWLLHDDEVPAFGRKFLPCGETSRIQRELGLREAAESAPAYAFMNGSGSGLSGQAWVQIARKYPNAWGLDAALE